MADEKISAMPNIGIFTTQFLTGITGGVNVKGTLPIPTVITASTFSTLPTGSFNGQLAITLDTFNVYVYNTSGTAWLLRNSITAANFAALPATGIIDGTLGVTLDTHNLYTYDLGTTTWVINEGSQVQSNWTEADNTDPSYIQNKPTLGTASQYNVGTALNTIPLLGALGALPAIPSGATTLTDPTTAAPNVALQTVANNIFGAIIEAGAGNSLINSAPVSVSYTDLNSGPVVIVPGITGVVLTVFDIFVATLTVAGAFQVASGFPDIVLQDTTGNTILDLVSGSPALTSDDIVSSVAALTTSDVYFPYLFQTALASGVGIQIANIGDALTQGGMQFALQYTDGSGGGSSGVTSFNTRAGAVTSQSGDYSIGQISGAGTAAAVNTGTANGDVPLLTSTGLPVVGANNVVVTDPSLAGPDSLETALANIYGATKVISFNSRSGVVSPSSGDYSIGQISGAGTAASADTGTANGDVPLLTSTGLPAVSAINTLVTDPSTATPNTGLNTTLANIWASMMGGDEGTVNVTNLTGSDIPAGTLVMIDIFSTYSPPVIAVMPYTYISGQSLPYAITNVDIPDTMSGLATRANNISVTLVDSSSGEGQPVYCNMGGDLTIQTGEPYFCVGILTGTSVTTTNTMYFNPDMFAQFNPEYMQIATVVNNTGSGIAASFAVSMSASDVFISPTNIYNTIQLFDGTLPLYGITLGAIANNQAGIIITEGPFSGSLLDGSSSASQEVYIVADPNSYTVTSLTSSGTTASGTVSGIPKWASGQQINIVGADQTEYNGLQTITITGTNTFIYTFAGSGTSPATGSISAISASNGALTVQNINSFVIGYTMSDSATSNIAAFLDKNAAFFFQSSPLPTQGTWTPVDNSAAGLSLTPTNCLYNITNNIVYFSGIIAFPSNASMVGIKIGGLPSISSRYLTYNLALFSTPSLTPATGICSIATSDGSISPTDPTTGTSYNNISLSGGAIAISGSYPLTV